MPKDVSLAVIEPEPAIAPDLPEVSGAPGLSEAAAYVRGLTERSELDGATRYAIEALLSAAEEARQRLERQERRIQQLADLSVTDELTGLRNRRGFQVELDRALARSRRNGETGVLILCDLDRFKAINDTYGHPAGDAALLLIAGLLHKQVRANDVVARLGGDEFAILLVDAHPNTVGGRIAAMKKALSGLVLACGHARVPVSTSLGHAAYGPDSTAETLIAMADNALYRAKPH